MKLVFLSSHLSRAKLRGSWLQLIENPPHFMAGFNRPNPCLWVAIEACDTERVDESGARRTNLGGNLDETSNQVQDSVREVASLKQVLGNQNNNLGDIEERLKQIENQIKYKFG